MCFDFFVCIIINLLDGAEGVYELCYSQPPGQDPDLLASFFLECHLSLVTFHFPHFSEEMR